MHKRNILFALLSVAFLFWGNTAFAKPPRYKTILLETKVAPATSSNCLMFPLTDIK